MTDSAFRMLAVNMGNYGLSEDKFHEDGTVNSKYLIRPSAYRKDTPGSTPMKQINYGIDTRSIIDAEFADRQEKTYRNFWSRMRANSLFTLDEEDNEGLTEFFFRMMPFGRAFTAWGREELFDDNEKILGLPKEFVKEGIATGLAFFGGVILRTGLRALPKLTGGAGAELYGKWMKMQQAARMGKEGLRQATHRTLAESTLYFGLGTSAGLVTEGNIEDALKEGGAWAVGPALGTVLSPVLRGASRQGTRIYNRSGEALKKIPFVEEWLIPPMETLVAAQERVMKATGIKLTPVRESKAYALRKIQEKADEWDSALRAIKEPVPKEFRIPMTLLLMQRTDDNVFKAVQKTFNIPEKVMVSMKRDVKYMRNAFDEVGSEMVNAGLMSKITLEKHIGKYYPHVTEHPGFKAFQKKIDAYAAKGKKVSYKELELDMSRMKQSVMQNMTPEMRLEFGLDTRVYTVAPREILREWTDIHINNMLHEINGSGLVLNPVMRVGELKRKGFRSLKNEKLPGFEDYWVQKDLFQALNKVQDPKERLRLTVKAFAEKNQSFASNNPKAHKSVLSKHEEYGKWMRKDGRTGQREFVHLPDDKTLYGPLAGKIVHPALLAEFKGWEKFTDNTTFNSLWKYYKQGLSTWKGAVTVWNLRYHVRNPITNMLLNHMRGMPFWNVDYYWRGLKETIRAKRGKGSAIFDTMIEGGMWNSSIVAGELGGNIDNISLKGAPITGLGQWFKQRFSRFNGKLGKLVQFEEQWAKVSKYMWNVEQLGMDTKDAVADAISSTFNYGEVPRAVRDMNNIVPFLTFPYKSFRMTAETLAKAPWRFTTIIAPFMAVNQAAIASAGITDEEYGRLKHEMPEYMQKGWYFMLPERDKKGRMQWVDYGYMLPFGDFIQNGTLSMKSIDRNNPLAAIVSDIRRNRDWLDRPIHTGWDPPASKVMKSTMHVWNSIMPSMIGRDIRKVHQTYRDVDPNALTPYQVGARQFGITVRPKSEADMHRSHYYNMLREKSEISKGFRKDLFRAKSDKEREKLVDKRRKMLKKLMEEYRR